LFLADSHHLLVREEEDRSDRNTAEAVMFQAFIAEFKREWALNFSPDCPRWERRLLTLLFLELAVIFFLVPAGRFHISLFSYKFSTGYDAYKLFPFLFAVWLLWRWKRRREWRIHFPIVFPAFLFFLISCLASSESPDAYQAISESLEIGCYILFFIMLLDLPWDERSVKWAAGGFIIGHWYLGWTAIWQLLFPSVVSGMFRIHATFDHPNSLGTYAVLSLSLLLWIYDRAQTYQQKASVLIAIGGILFAALFAFSRSGCVGLFVFGYVLYAALKAGSPNVFRRIASIVLVVALFVGASALMRLSSTMNELLAKQNVSRLTIWPFVMDRNMPSLPFFGVGLGPVQMNADFSVMISAPMDLPISSTHYPHDLYLELLISMGISGLLSFLWLVYEGFRQTYGDRTITAAALRAGLAGFLAQEIFDTQILNGNIPIALFVILALGSYSAIQRRKIIENEKIAI